MQTFTVRITALPTADFPLYFATIDETDAVGIRGDRLDPEGDPRLGARFPGISDHLTFHEKLEHELVYEAGGTGPNVLVYRSREAIVTIHDVVTRPLAGACDITEEELNEIILALTAKLSGQNTFPEEAVVRYIERLVKMGHIGIVHRVIELYGRGKPACRPVIAKHLPRILSNHYRPIVDGDGTAAFQEWAMSSARTPLLDKLRKNAWNSMLPGVIDEVLQAFENRDRR